MANLFILSILLTLSTVPHILSIPFDERDLESDAKVWDLYERWQLHHSIRRDHHEKQRRFGVFKENAKFIHEFNKRANNKKRYKLALNKFGDLSKEEFMGGYAGVDKERNKMVRSHEKSLGGFMYAGVSVKDLPVSVDWRAEGAVNGVKDQGKCGSCWAFSTVASVEGINQIKTGSLVSLSEQELVDCESDNSGCNGGLMENAFEFIKSSGGITTETAYPYRAANGTCDAKKLNSPVVVIDGHENVPVNSEDNLMKAVANQPVSVAMDASSKAFQFYSEGVFTGDCNTELNHGVVVVGYGEDSSDDSGVKYWTVRNSWGADWGEQGYIRMQRNVEAKEGLCGIAMDASYPVKTSPNPSKKRRNTNRRQLNRVGPQSS